MATVDSIAREVEDLKSKLRLFEEQQAKIMESMSTQVQNEVKTVTSNLDTLYKETLQAMTMLSERVKKLQTSGGKSRKSLIKPKSFAPEVLSRDEDWRKWKSDVED